MKHKKQEQKLKDRQASYDALKTEDQKARVRPGSLNKNKQGGGQPTGWGKKR